MNLMNLKDIDEKLLLFLKETDKKRQDINFFLETKYSITKDQVSRSLGRVSHQNLIKRPRRGIYGLTEEGKARTQGLSLDTEPLSKYEKIAKILNRLPLHLQAFTTLYLCGIIARRHLREYHEEGFPSFLIYSKKGTGKTGSIRVLFRLLNLDFEEHSRYLPTASIGELGLRRFKEKGKHGYAVEASSYFEKPAFCFQEIGKADKPVRDALWVYFQSEKNYTVEGEKFEHKVCAVATSNASPQEIKMPDGIYRRTPMLNTNAIEKQVKNIDLILRKLQKGNLPYLNLSKLKPKFNKLTDPQYELLHSLLMECATDDAWNYKVDTLSTQILSLAMQALLKTETIEEAIFFTLYCRLQLLETTNDTVENWKEILFMNWKKRSRFPEDYELEIKQEIISPEVPLNSKVAKKLKKMEDELKIETEFKPQHEEIMALVDERINMQNFMNGVSWKFLTAEEQKKFNIAFNAFNRLKKIGSHIKKGDWVGLKALKSTFSNTNNDQYLPLVKLSKKANQSYRIQQIEERIEPYVALPEDEWDRDKYDSLKDLEIMITNDPFLEEEQKKKLKETFPKIYYEMPGKLKAAEEARQRSIKKERETSKTIANIVKTISSELSQEKQSKLRISTESKKELDTRTPVHTTTSLPQRTMPPGKPIGRAEYFDLYSRRWVVADIWKCMPDSLGKDKFLIKWVDSLDRKWVPGKELRKIEYFN